MSKTAVKQKENKKKNMYTTTIENWKTKRKT